MIFLDVDPDLNLSIPPDLLEHAAQAALDLQSALDADLTLVVVDDAEIQTLNRDFRGVDTPTDVLAFTADETDPETGRMYLGDVIISAPHAAVQAQAGGHALEAELQLLVAHGVLHLMGYDHASEGDKTRMWAVQAEILKRLGVSPAIIHE